MFSHISVPFSYDSITFAELDGFPHLCLQKYLPPDKIKISHPYSRNIINANMYHYRGFQGQAVFECVRRV